MGFQQASFLLLLGLSLGGLADRRFLGGLLGLETFDFLRRLRGQFRQQSPARQLDGKVLGLRSRQCPIVDAEVIDQPFDRSSDVLIADLERRGGAEGLAQMVL